MDNSKAGGITTAVQDSQCSEQPSYDGASRPTMQGLVKDRKRRPTTNSGGAINSQDSISTS